MNQHTITNNNSHPIYVGLVEGGSVAVMPGESRPFNVAELAPAWRPDVNAEDVAAATGGTSAEDELVAEIKKLRKKSAKELIELLPDMEPSLLVRLGEAEQVDDAPRKTLLSAIAEEQLRRSAEEHRLAEEAAAAKAKADAEAAALAAGGQPGDGSGGRPGDA